MNKLHFDAEKHIYTYNSSVIPSVTQVIGDLLPFQYADVWKAQRGKAIHACAAMIANDKQFVYDHRIDGYIDAIYKFFKEVNPVVIETEMMLASKKYRFAGTLDLFGIISGRHVILDYKSYLDEDRIGLQLAGYSLLLAETGNIIKYGYGVQIKADGNYSMTRQLNLKKYQREFLVLRSAYSIRERLGYIRIGG